MDLGHGLAFLMLLPFFLHTDGLYIANNIESLQGTLGEYGLVTPISTDSEGRFLSHAVSTAHGRRRSRRDTEGSSHEPRSDRLFFNVTVFGKEFHLRLRLNSRLVAPGAKIEWQEDTNVTRTEPLLGDCFYVGDITDVQGASVAISNCDGLAGMIRTEKEEFFIEPVESDGELGEEEQGGRQHIVYRKSSIKTRPSNQTSDFHGKAVACNRKRKPLGVWFHCIVGHGVLKKKLTCFFLTTLNEEDYKLKIKFLNWKCFNQAEKAI